MIGRRKAHLPARSRGFDLEARHPDRRALSGCVGKDRYTSEAAAWAGAGLVQRVAIDVYRCESCQGYHLTERRPKGQRKTPPPVQVLAFICAACKARHTAIAVSPREWTPETRRAALLKLEPEAIADGWSVGVDDDHCPSCAAALGLETYRRTA